MVNFFLCSSFLKAILKELLQEVQLLLKMPIVLFFNYTEVIQQAQYKSGLKLKKHK